MLERLLLWISNCVQLLLFLKHTFQLPELSTPEIRPMRRCSINSPRNEHTLKQPSPRKEDSAKHALAQLVTGLEEIIMFCFQQSVYTITKVSLKGTDLSSRETTLSKLFLSSFEKVYSIRKEFVPSYKIFSGNKMHAVDNVFQQCQQYIGHVSLNLTCDIVSSQCP